MTPTVVWLLIGFVLLVAELATGTFMLIFFGLSALLVALIRQFGVDSWPLEGTLFALFGVLCVLFFRKRLQQSFESREKLSVGDEFQSIRAPHDLRPQESCSVEYQGSVFTAVNIGREIVSEGEMMRIERTEGVKLLVKKGE